MLAAWGYIRPEWRSVPQGVGLLDPEGMDELFARLRS